MGSILRRYFLRSTTENRKINRQGDLFVTHDFCGAVAREDNWWPVVKSLVQMLVG